MNQAQAYTPSFLLLVFSKQIYTQIFSQLPLYSASIISLLLELVQQVKLGCGRMVLLLIHSNIFQNLREIKEDKPTFVSKSSLSDVFITVEVESVGFDRFLKYK